jgi:hypothetical protein
MIVGTPALENASCRISNSVQVGTSRQSTMAIVGGSARAPSALARRAASAARAVVADGVPRPEAI